MPPCKSKAQLTDWKAGHTLQIYPGIQVFSYKSGYSYEGKALKAGAIEVISFIALVICNNSLNLYWCIHISQLKLKNLSQVLLVITFYGCKSASMMLQPCTKAVQQWLLKILLRTLIYILDINHIFNVGLTDTTTYICDFHREQCWDRWLRKSENGLTASREEVLTLLRSVAKSSTKESLEKNLSSLKDNELWQGNPKLRNWFEKTWLTESKVRMDIQ